MISLKSHAAFIVVQWFPTMFLEAPQHCMFPCLPSQTHLIQIISSLVETPRPEMGVSEKGEMQNVHCWGASRNVVGNHCCSAHLGPWR